MTYIEDDSELNAVLEQITLSSDLKKATSKSIDEIAKLFNLKTDVQFDVQDIQFSLDEIEEEVEKAIEQLKEGFADTVSTNEKLRAISSSASLTLHIRNIVEVKKRINKIREDFDFESEDLELAVNLANIVSPLIRMRSHNDVVPLITRGIYAEDIKQALLFWEANRSNKNGATEQTWQDELYKRRSILGRVLGGRIILLNQQAHVGADDLEGKGDKITDYIFQHSDTLDVTLVEIKTPHEHLLGKSYRGTYALSPELSGTVSQILVQRNELYKNYFKKVESSETKFEVNAPRCVIVAGDVGKEIAGNKEKRKAFELQRQALSSSVSIIAFDELYDQFMRFNVI